MQSSVKVTASWASRNKDNGRANNGLTQFLYYFIFLQVQSRSDRFRLVPVDQISVPRHICPRLYIKSGDGNRPKRRRSTSTVGKALNRRAVVINRHTRVCVAVVGQSGLRRLKKFFVSAGG